MSVSNPILLVEDCKNDIELTLAALEENQLGNRVVVLRDGAEALDYLTHVNGEMPAVVLLDIKMPKVSGLEVLRSIKSDARLKEIPVVMLTSSREGPDIDQCYELGANAYVVKPVDFGQFFEAVKAVGRFWAVVNQRSYPPQKGAADRAGDPSDESAMR